MKLKPHEKKAWKAYQKRMSPARTGGHPATKEGFREASEGEWDTELAFAENVFDDHYLHKIPECIQCYIDYKSFAVDLFSDYFSIGRKDGGVYVFRNI